MDKLKEKALSLGATQFGESEVRGKRFFVVYNGKKINFGLKGGSTYIDHGDNKKRDAWRARHGKIKLKTGEYAYKIKAQPEYWSWHLLW